MSRCCVPCIGMCSIFYIIHSAGPVWDWLWEKRSTWVPVLMLDYLPVIFTVLVGGVIAHRFGKRRDSHAYAREERVRQNRAIVDFWNYWAEAFGELHSFINYPEMLEIHTQALNQVKDERDRLLGLVRAELGHLDIASLNLGGTLELFDLYGEMEYFKRSQSLLVPLEQRLRNLSREVSDAEIGASANEVAKMVSGLGEFKTHGSAKQHSEKLQETLMSEIFRDKVNALKAATRAYFAGGVG